MIDGGWLNLAPGEITDDTQMTLCVAEGIVEDPADPIEASAGGLSNGPAAAPKTSGARAGPASATPKGWAVCPQRPKCGSVPGN